MDKIKRYRFTFFFLLAALFLFRLWFMTTLPLSGDETYHWEWSRNPAFGYYDHPGLTAYLILLSTWLFGRSTVFTVRLPALLMLTGTAIICFFFARLIARTRGASDENAERAGLLAGLLILITPVFSFFSMYISTDPPLLFFWTLTLYLLYRAFHTNSWPTWIGAGIAMGLAIMSKFLACFLVPAVLIFVIVSPEDRKILKKPQAYVAGICCLLVISPLLWWNATHEWATIMFNFIHRQKATGLVLWHVPEFILLTQPLVLSPGIFAFAVFILWRMMREWIKTKQRDSLFLVSTSLVPLLYFLYVSLREQVGPHWPAGAWIGAIVYLAYYWEASGATGQNIAINRLKKISLSVCVVFTIVLYILPHTIHELAQLCDWHYPGDPRIKTQKTAELFGLREMGEWVTEVRNKMDAAQGEKGKGVFVICPSYSLASTVAFYTPDQIRTHLWSRIKTHGENYRFWDDFRSLKDMDAVFVAKKEKYTKNAIPKLKEHFLSVEASERLPVLLDGKEIRSFFLIRCYKFNGIEPDFTK